MRCEINAIQNTTMSYPTVDELLSQQAAHHVGAEVNDVLDLPEGLLHRLEDKDRQVGKHTGKQKVIPCSET